MKYLSTLSVYLKRAQEILVNTNMVEIFKTAGIDYRHGPEKGVGFQYFSEVSPASKAMMVKNEQ